MAYIVITGRGGQKIQELEEKSQAKIKVYIYMCICTYNLVIACSSV